MNELQLSEVKKIIADKIAHAIVDAGLQKQQFADLMGVQPSVVTKWLKGDTNFETKTLFKIEQILGVRLFDFSSTPESPSAPTSTAREEMPFDVCTDIYKMWQADKQGFYFPPYQAGAIAMYREMKAKLSDNAFDWIQKCNEITSENTALREELEKLKATKVSELLAKYPLQP
jgi:transcriptional regulator with XRE-family HTH domain